MKKETILLAEPARVYRRIQREERQVRLRAFLYESLRMLEASNATYVSRHIVDLLDFCQQNDIDFGKMLKTARAEFDKQREEEAE